MSSIKVKEPHSLSKDEAKERLGVFEQSLEKFGVKLAWRGDRADIKGTGVGGDVIVRDDAVEVRLKLGMLARAAGVDAGRLQGSIEKRLKAALSGEVEA